MGYAIRCRKCHTNLAGMTYLRFGDDTIPGPRALCLRCINVCMQGTDFRDFLPWVRSYIAENKSSKRVTSELRERVAELEAIVKALRKE